MENISEAYELQLEENTYDTSFLPTEQDFFYIVLFLCYVHRLFSSFYTDKYHVVSLYDI